MVYAVYLRSPRLFGLSSLEDQQCAGALMWTCITLIFLVPAVKITMSLLVPNPEAREFAQIRLGESSSKSSGTSLEA